MDPLALVAAPGGRVHDAQGEQVRVGALALAQARSEELNQTLEKLTHFGVTHADITMTIA